MSDDDLRRRFEALRLDEANRAPGFEALRHRGDAASRRLRRQSRWRWVWAPALATCGAVAWIAFPRAPEVSLASWELGRWAAPTDVLLELPGSALLREVPSLEIDLAAPISNTGYTQTLGRTLP